MWDLDWQRHEASRGRVRKLTVTDTGSTTLTGAVARALGEGRALYTLADGAEMEGPIAALRAGHRLTQVANLPLPYFSPNGGSDDRHLALYRVEPSGT